MIEGIPRISVRIICYKQEELIKRAINSLLAQRDYIYEICVSDDCSPDRTWEVLQEYDRQYPGLFKLHRNEHNLGIFENIEQSWTMPTGDIVCGLAGDDAYSEGWFESIVNFIRDNNIDYKNELFCIYGDSKVVYPNGDAFVSRNTLVAKYPQDTLSLAMRGAISISGCCYSINILKKFEKVSDGRAYYVEEVQDRQVQLYTERAYYNPHIGNIYYANIGVCVQLRSKEQKDRNQLYSYALEYLSSKTKLKKSDVRFLQYKDKEIVFINNRTMLNFLTLTKYWVKSFSFAYDLRLSKFKRFIFAILRRMPHSRPLDFKL